MSRFSELEIERLNRDQPPKKSKKAFNYRSRMANDMHDLYINPGSVLHCDKCKERLGVLHTLRNALFKKPGVSYIVVCKRCKHPNVRTKGAYKQQVEGQWKKLEAEIKDDEQNKRP